MVAVFSTMISIGTRAGTFAKSWSIVFAGKDATLVGYSQTALLMYLVASGAVLRFAEFDEKHFPHFHLRFGRRRRWLGNQLLQAAKFCVSGTVVIFIAIFFTVVLHNHNLASQDIVLVSSTAFGMLLSMLVITTFGLVAYSFSKSAESWVWVVGVSLVLGYLPTTVPGNLSILTLYSHSIVSHEVVRLQSFSAGGLVLVVGLILLHIANLVSRNGSVRLLERDRG